MTFEGSFQPKVLYDFINGRAACKQSCERSASLNCANITESVKHCLMDKVTWKLFWRLCFVRQILKKQQLSNVKVFSFGGQFGRLVVKPLKGHRQEVS